MLREFYFQPPKLRISLLLPISTAFPLPFSDPSNAENPAAAGTTYDGIAVGASDGKIGQPDAWESRVSK